MGVHTRAKNKDSNFTLGALRVDSFMIVKNLNARNLPFGEY